MYEHGLGFALQVDVRLAAHVDAIDIAFAPGPIG
jgi:hypothetical protein